MDIDYEINFSLQKQFHQKTVCFLLIMFQSVKKYEK